MYPQTARKVLAKLKYPVPEQGCKPAVSLADAGLAALGTRGRTRDSGRAWSCSCQNAAGHLFLYCHWTKFA